MTPRPQTGGKWRAFFRGLGNFGIAIGSAVLLQFLLGRFIPAWFLSVLAVVVVLAVYVFGSVRIEHRRPADLLDPRAGPLALEGLVLGCVLFATLIGILAVLGNYRFTGWGSPRGLVSGLALATLAAVFEETLFRGFLFRLFAQLGGNWLGLAITSALFGLAHLGNPHATIASSSAIAIEAGILLGAAYAFARSLWLPIGIHAGWNFTEGPVFGTSVSGNSVTTGWITGSLHGPALVTGGQFGPEASIFAVVLCLIPAVFFALRMPPPEPIPDLVRRQP